MRRFGERLRVWRRAAGISQPALAKALGVSQSAVSGWETGAACPKRPAVPGLAEALGVTVEEIERALAEDVEAKAAGVLVDPEDIRDRMDSLEEHLVRRLDRIEARLEAFVEESPGDQ